MMSSLGAGGNRFLLSTRVMFSRFKKASSLAFKYSTVSREGSGLEMCLRLTFCLSIGKDM